MPAGDTNDPFQPILFVFCHSFILSQKARDALYYFHHHGSGSTIERKSTWKHFHFSDSRIKCHQLALRNGFAPVKIFLPGFMEFPLKKEIEMLPPLKVKSRSLNRNHNAIKKILLIRSGDNMEKVWFSNPDFCPAPERLKWESNGLTLFIKTKQERVQQSNISCSITDILRCARVDLPHEIKLAYFLLV